MGRESKGECKSDVGWEIELRSAGKLRIDVSQIQPTGCLPEMDWQKQLIFLGRDRLEAGDLFRIRRRGSDPSEVWIGELARVDGIGAGNLGRTIRIDSSVGQRIGLEMKSGRIDVWGDAGADLGCGLQGGQIFIRGNCGDRVGGCLPGQRNGMSGGLIVIRGNAGEFAGERLRRGVLMAGGVLGRGAAHQMIAGTLVARRLIPPHGYEIQRGTLICAEFEIHAPTRMDSIDPNPIRAELLFPQLLWKQLHDQNLHLPEFDFLKQPQWLRVPLGLSASSRLEMFVAG